MQASINECNPTFFGNLQPLANIVITQIGEIESVNGHQTGNSAKLRFLSPEDWTLVVVHLGLSPSTGITEYQANPEMLPVRVTIMQLWLDRQEEIFKIKTQG